MASGAEETTKDADAEAVADGFPLTVADDTGYEVTIESKPQRIVSVTLFTDDVLLDIVDTSRIIGVTDFADDKAISNVAGRVDTIPNKVVLNVEVILGLQPDLVFVANWSEADKVQQLRAAGVNVFLVASALSVEAIQEKIRTVAHTVGEEEKGEFLVEEMDVRLANVRGKIRDIDEADRLTVVDYATWGSAQGAGSSWNEIITQAGCINAVGEYAVDDWGQVPLSREKLIEINPDILILPGWVYGDPKGAENFFNQTINDPSLKTIQAIVNNQAFMMPERLKSTTSQYIIDAIEFLAKTAYPQAFK